MTGGRFIDKFVLIGCAGARSPWFADLTRWSTSGVMAAEYIKALSMDEVRAILGSGRKASALIVSSSTSGLDRDIVALVRSFGAAVIVVAETGPQRDWDSIGVATTLPNNFGPDQLLEALTRHATRIDPSERQSSQIAVRLDPDEHLAPLVAVAGAGGAGVSTIAMATAQGLAAQRADMRAAEEMSEQSDDSRVVALADLSRSSDLAMYHDIGDVIPALPELVELHRGDTPDPDDVRALLYGIDNRGYEVLLGQRRIRDSASMAPLSSAAAIDGLRRSYDIVVADLEATIEGESETGSLDIEMFNAVQRHSFSVASVLLLVVEPSLRGYRRLATLVATAAAFGVAAERLVPVINFAPRSAPARAAITRLVADMNPLEEPIAPPLFCRRSRIMEDLHRAVSPLPGFIAEPLGRTASSLVERSSPPSANSQPVLSQRRVPVLGQKVA